MEWTLGFLGIVFLILGLIGQAFQMRKIRLKNYPNDELGSPNIFMNKNNYNFSEIYIDEKKKQIIGSDIKAFLNQSDILINEDNEPRFFANTVQLNEKINTFEKGIFTYCKKKENEKCPPWVLQSKKIKHDLSESWEVLSEAIQTVMRRYGISEPYEKLKKVTRGEKVNEDLLHELISTLDIPEKARDELLNLTPSKYTGIAQNLTEKI